VGDVQGEPAMTSANEALAHEWINNPFFFSALTLTGTSLLMKSVIEGQLYYEHFLNEPPWYSPIGYSRG
jgi:hypothetical protein